MNIQYHSTYLKFKNRQIPETMEGARVMTKKTHKVDFCCSCNSLFLNMHKGHKVFLILLNIPIY